MGDGSVVHDALVDVGEEMSDTLDTDDSFHSSSVPFFSLDNDSTSIVALCDMVVFPWFVMVSLVSLVLVWLDGTATSTDQLLRVGDRGIPFLSPSSTDDNVRPIATEDNDETGLLMCSEDVVEVGLVSERRWCVDGVELIVDVVEISD